MGLMKNLTFGMAGLLLLASPLNAADLFKIEYTLTSMRRVSGIYSCVGHYGRISKCKKTDGAGPEEIFMDFSNGEIGKINPLSGEIDYKFKYEKDKGVSAQPLGKLDIRKFINEISP